MVNQYREGSNRITVDIVDRDEELVGPGDIMTCLGVEYTEVLNGAGTWSARFPANDPILERLLLKAHFLDFYVDGQKIVRGLTEKQDWELSNDGQQIVALSGRDLLAELDEVTTDFMLMTVAEEPEPIDFAPSSIINYYDEVVSESSPSIYNWIVPQSFTETLVYGSYIGESALTALRRVAEQTGESFRLLSPGHAIYPARTLEWLQTATPDSGVRAVGGAGDAVDAEDNPFVCFIQGLTERRDASRMMARIVPYGSGLGETRLDLVGLVDGVDIDVPTGFTFDVANNSITNDNALAYVGKMISRHVNFKEIRPLFNTDADTLYAKVFLFNAALAYLQRNDDVDDTLEYGLSVLQLPAHVRVGMTLRVVWQDELRDIDRDLVILAIRTSVGSNGERTYALTVATINQWRFRETNNIVSDMEEGQIFNAHPQIDATAYWMPFREIIGDDQTDHMAEFPFWLSAEIVTIRQVLFRFAVESAFAVMRSYTYVSAITDQNAAANTGSTAAIIDSTAAIIDSTAATINSTAAVIDSAAPDAGNTNITVNASGSTAIGDASVALSSTNEGGVDSATQGALSTNPTNHWHDMSTHQHAHAHTHPVTAEHGHVANTHFHTTIAHTHTSTAHTHTETAHTHTSTAHTHTSPTHLHSSPQHTHTMAVLTFSTVPVRVPALNSYIIGDLEFAVNGGAWAALNTAIPVAGGYSELDITGQVQNPAGLKRPYQEYNFVQVRRTTAAGTDKTAQIRAQIGIRATVQSIVLYE